MLLAGAGRVIYLEVGRAPLLCVRNRPQRANVGSGSQVRGHANSAGESLAQPAVRRGGMEECELRKIF